MRRSLPTAVAALALVLAAGCSDDAAGPRAPLVGQLAVVPNFGTLQGGLVEIARGRFVLTRIPGGAVARDTVIDIPAGADSVDLSLTVPVLVTGETFDLTIALISPAGDTVFRGGPIVVAPGTSGTPVAVDVPFSYVGPGAAAAGVRIVSPDTSTLTGVPVLLTAEAFDSAEVALPGTPIGWTSLDTGRVQVTTDALYRGLAVGGTERGVARLVATLVTGQTDTVFVSNQPLPTAIAADSGNAQSALADSTLPQALVARVTAADGLGVSGLWVRFAISSGGGILSADSVLTDATGRAGVAYTLARTFQTPTVTATTALLGTQTAMFTATLLFPPTAVLEVVTGDAQTAIAGSPVDIAPQVRALDADGLPVPGVTVTFAVSGGGGIVAGGTPVTDTLGLAAVTSWTLGVTAGPNTLQASANGITAEFTATGIAGSRQVYWNNPAGGNWSNPANWLAGAVPGTTDTVFITLDGSYTVAVDAAVTIDQLVMGGTSGTQTLAVGAAPITVSGNADFGATSAISHVAPSAITIGGNLALAGGHQTTNATLAVGGTLDIASTATVTLDDAALTGTGAVTNAGTLTVNPGATTLGGALANTASGTLTLVGNTGGADLTVAAGVANAGAIAVTGGFGSFLRVPAGALVHTGTLTTSGTANHTLAAALDNQGTVDVQGSGALTLNAVSAAHANTGVMQLTGGNLAIAQSGTTPSFTLAAGTFDIGPGRTFTVTGGTFSFTGGTLQGEGAANLTATTIGALDGTFAPGTSPGLLTLDLPPGAALGASAVVSIELGADPAANPPGVDNDLLLATNALLGLGGTLDITLLAPFVPLGTESWPLLAGVTGSFVTVNLPAGLNAVTSTVNDTLFLGPPVAAGPGVNTWIATGGVWSADANWSLGRAPIPDDTVQLTLGLDYQVTMDVSATVATLTIGGTGDVISLDVGDQTLTITDPGPGSGLDIQPLGSIQVGNGGIVAEQISNQGSVRWTGAAPVLGTGLVSNLGGWTVVGGQLTVAGEGTFDFRTSGLLRIENDATMIFDNGFLTYLGGTIEAGLGTGNVLAFTNGAELGLQADLAFDSLVVALVNGRIQYFNGDERLTIGPNAGITMDGTVLAEVTAIVENQGVITATAGTANYVNDSLYNAATGVIAVNASGAAVQLGIAGTENLGTVFLFGDQPATLTVSGGGSGLTNRAGAGLNTAGTGSHVFSGILVNESGADVTLASPLTIRRPLVANHVNGGTIDVTAGDLTIELTVSGASFTNQGTMNVTGGDVLVTMAGTSPTFVNAGTLTVESPRSFSISNASNGAFTNAADGVLQGTGTIDVSGGSPTVTNLGTIAPGLSPGILTWAGALALASTSTIPLDLDGIAAGTGYDQLNVSGAATLGGALALSPTFLPAAGTIFKVLTFGSATGAFSDITNRDLVPQFGIGMVIDPLVSATSFDLVARGQVLLHGGGAAGSGIFRAFGDGSKTELITSEFSFTGDGQPRWSPDYKWVTYGGNVSSGNNFLHIALPDGSVVYHVVNDMTTRRARFSMLGTHIAFECEAGYVEVCTVTGVQAPAEGMGDRSGSSPAFSVTDAVNANLGGPGVFAWNPVDDDQLAVVRDTVPVGGPATSAVYTVNFAGSGVTRIAVLPVGETIVGTMDWSPDGALLAFGAVDGQGTKRLYTLDVGSGTLTPITDGSAIDDERPVFSPDGSEILFVGGLDTCKANYYAIRPDGTDRRQLTNDDLCDFNTDDLGHDWSPDGTWIVLSGATSGVVPDAVFLVPASVSTTTYALLRILARGPAGSVSDIQASWRP